MENTLKYLRNVANSLVGKVLVFQVQEIHLYYTGGMFYVNVRLAIYPSLAKLAKRIGDYTMISTCILFSWLGKTTSSTPTLVIEGQEWRKITK